MNLHNIFNSTTTLLKRNSPIILSSTAITGVITTAYLSSKATKQAINELVHEHPVYVWKNKQDRLKHDIKRVWRFYIPAVASGGITIACIVGTARITNKRASAAQAAFILSERAYSEYRAKVIEEYGERKDQGFRDSIAEDRVHKNPPPPSGEIMIAGPGNVLCCELMTGRYFSSDMETLRKSQNDINARLIRDDAASADDFYRLVGLRATSTSGNIGWNSDRMMALEFTTVLTEDNRPCLAFDYNYIKPF